MKTSNSVLPAILVSTALVSASALAEIPEFRPVPFYGSFSVATETPDALLLQAPTPIEIDAQTCLSSRSGVTLALPGLAAGFADGPIALTHNSTTLQSIPASQITEVKTTNKGAFTLKANDEKGKFTLSAEGSKNEFGRYQVVIRRASLGMMGFLCGANANK